MFQVSSANHPQHVRLVTIDKPQDLLGWNPVIEPPNCPTLFINHTSNQAANVAFSYLMAITSQKPLLNVIANFGYTQYPLTPGCKIPVLDLKSKPSCHDLELIFQQFMRLAPENTVNASTLLYDGEIFWVLGSIETRPDPSWSAHLAQTFGSIAQFCLCQKYNSGLEVAIGLSVAEATAKGLQLLIIP